MSEIIAKISAREACENLVISYANLIDSGRASEATSLFTENASLTLPTTRAQGAEIKDALITRQLDTTRKTCHIISNFQFSMLTARKAKATSVTTLYVFAEDILPITPTSIVRNDDEFLLTKDGEWRIQNRLTSRVWPNLAQ